MENFRPFRDTFTARFLARPNRFLLRCEQAGRIINAYLPNPGRLLELLLPGCTVHVMPEQGRARRTDLTAVAVERDGDVIMLHTHRANDAARWLIAGGLVPGLDRCRIVRSEFTVGRHRFDLLLEDRQGPVVVEVKSCTLAGRSVAMFPDAVTERGAQHLRELARLSAEGTRTVLLFVVHHASPTIFMPDFHTDLNFARTLIDVRNEVAVLPLGVRWEPDLSLSRDVRFLSVPWDHVEREARDRGSYLCLLELSRDSAIPIGALGEVTFRRGFYAYVGSAMGNLTSRVNRHRHLRKRRHWHIDRLRQAAHFVMALPVRSSARLECEIAASLMSIADWPVAGFGCTDCLCSTHLFGFDSNPLHSRAFHNLLAWFRMDRHADLI